MEQHISGDTRFGSTNPHSDDRRRNGRPPLPREIARSKRVVTFVTEGDKIKLDELAIKQSTSLSAVIYDLISAGLKDQSITELDEEK